MQHNYQQPSLQTLIDLLAEETEKYNKGFASSSSIENEYQRGIINALIEEILLRKRGLIPAGAENSSGAKDDFPCC